jgi:hypothetical protein
LLFRSGAPTARLVDTRDYKRQLIIFSAVKKRFFIHHFVGVIFAARKISHGSESC